jgi:hypothetical protein
MKQSNAKRRIADGNDEVTVQLDVIYYEFPESRAAKTTWPNDMDSNRSATPLPAASPVPCQQGPEDGLGALLPLAGDPF